MPRAGLLLVFGVLHTGCSDPAATPPDAKVIPDVGSYPGDIQCITQVVVSCQGAGASITTTTSPPNPMYICPESGSSTVQASCANGCSVSGSETFLTSYAMTPISLCAETPDVQIGDSCTTSCVPTRAALAGDGTVLSEAYLACDSGSHRCVAQNAPVLPNYLHACDPSIVAQHNGQSVNGVDGSPNAWMSSCLLAWDSAAQAMTSGVTHVCIGDWECPEGSLCDDQITSLVGGPLAVCKPGPRGTLTPAMLTPS